MDQVKLTRGLLRVQFENWRFADSVGQRHRGPEQEGEDEHNFKLVSLASELDPFIVRIELNELWVEPQL